MGCSVSKSTVEPCAVVVKFSGCGADKISRSSSSPIERGAREHQNPFKNQNADHVVSLTSSTYGSLDLDSLSNLGEERNRKTRSNANLLPSRGPSSWSKEGDPPLRVSDQHGIRPVETINMWELMDGIEDEKATLQILRSLMEKPKASGQESGRSSPRASTTIHTIEDVDTIMDVRRALPTDYSCRRGSSMETLVPVLQSREFKPHSDKTRDNSSVMLLKRRSRAMESSQDVQDVDHQERRILSRSQEFLPTRKSNLSRSQEFHPTRNVSQSQDFDSVRGSNLNRTQELDSFRRANLYWNQQINIRKSNNLSRSQEYTRPFVQGKEVAPSRHSHSEIPRPVIKQDEAKVALPQPDVVLRSPMLRGLSGPERMRPRPKPSSIPSSDAIKFESKSSKPLLQGQAQAVAKQKTTLAKDSFNLDSTSKIGSIDQQKSGKFLEPRVASAVATFSRLGEKKPPSSNAQTVSEAKADVSREQSFNTAKAAYSVSEIPAYRSVARMGSNTNYIVPQEPAPDARKISTAKQHFRSFSASNKTASS